LSGHTQGSGGPVVGGSGAGVEDFAAGDVLVGAQGQPGGKVFDGGPLGHIEADFGDNGLSGEGIDAIDLGKINAGELEKVKAEVKIRAVIAVASGASGWG